MKISIAIPTYECHGKGWLYLSELFNSIYKQSEKDVEVVVSDQSTDDKILNLCNYYSHHLNIKHIFAKNIQRSNSVNANNAIKNCSSDIIKIMFADDFFVDEKCIEKTVNHFNNLNVNWIVCGSLHCENIHFLGKPIIPHYNSNIHIGNNTISSPSVLSFRGKHYFDEKLIMLMDCDMYKNLYEKYGEPLIISEYHICNRQHELQMQNTHSGKLKLEMDYCFKKYIKEKI